VAAAAAGLAAKIRRKLAGAATSTRASWWRRYQSATKDGVGAAKDIRRRKRWRQRQRLGKRAGWAAAWRAWQRKHQRRIRHRYQRGVNIGGVMAKTSMKAASNHINGGEK